MNNGQRGYSRIPHETIEGTANQITVTNGDGADGNPTISLPAAITLPGTILMNTGSWRMLDTNASHYLQISPGSDLTANRGLVLTTGDANRTLDVELMESIGLSLADAPGILSLTAADDVALRTIAGTTGEIDVADGDGSTGNPTISLAAAVPTWVKYTLSHTDFQTAGVTRNVTIFSLPAGGVIEAVKMKHSTQFAITGGASYTISVGIATSTTKYAPAFNVLAATGATVYQLSALIGGESHVAAADILAVATGDVNLDNSTAGAIDIWVKWAVAV